MSLTECVENLRLQDCQRFFSTLMDSSAKKDEETVNGDDSMTCDGTEVEDIDAKACMECLRTQSADIEVIPKICMLALRALQQSKSSSDILRWCQVALFACSRPGAAAMGCKTFSVLNLILTRVNEQIGAHVKDIDEDHVKPSKPVSANEEEAEDMEDERPAAAIRKTRAKPKRTASDNGAQGPFANMLAMVCETVEMWKDIKDEHLLTVLAEILWSAAFVCHSIPDLHKRSDQIKACIGRFLGLSAHSLMACHRVIVPILSFNTARSSNMPTKQKSLKTMHTVVAKLYCDLLQHFMPLVTLEVEPGVSMDLLATPAKGRAILIDAPSTAASVVSTLSTDSTPMRADANTASRFPLSITTVLGLLQRMVLSCPTDKQNLRNAVAQSVAEIIISITGMLEQVNTAALTVHLVGCVQYMLSFLNKLLTSNKVVQRSIALEILSNLISLDFLWLNHEAYHMQALFVRFMERCEDHNAVVRFKALNVLFGLISDKSLQSPPKMNSVLFDYAYGILTVKNRSLFDLLKQLLFIETKVTVKIKVLQIYCLALTKPWYQGEQEKMMTISDEDIQLFVLFAQPNQPSAKVPGEPAALSNSINLRKQALQGLMDIVMLQPGNLTVVNTFVSVALPLVHDSEASIVAKVISAFQCLIFDNIQAWYDHSKKNSAAGAHDVLGWVIIDKLFSMGLNALFKSLLLHMIKQRTLTLDNTSSSLNNLLRILKHACTLGGDGDDLTKMISHSAWVTLDNIISHHQLKVEINSVPTTLAAVLTRNSSISFVVSVYQSKRSASDAMDEEDVRILNILKQIPSILSEEQASYVLGEVDRHLQNIATISNNEVLSILIQLRFSLTKHKEDWCKDVLSWCNGFMQSIYLVIYSFIFMQLPPQSASAAGQGHVLDLIQAHLNGSNQEEIVKVVNNYLFVLGEISMLGFQLDELDASKHKANTFAYPASNPAVPLKYIHSPDSGYFKVLYPDSLVSLVTLLMGQSLPSAENRRCPNKLRAMAFICFGKLCLRDYKLSRDNINIFIREVNPIYSTSSTSTAAGSDLMNSSSLANISDISMNCSMNELDCNDSVRNNALLILGDLCVKYTHLVDKYIDVLASCLQDRNASIRKHTLLMMTQLLSQDFIKLKGMLFYRFLLLLNDPDLQIQSFATDLLQRTLRAKYPSIFQNHFVELFIILNKCSDHPMGNLLLCNFMDGEEDMQESSMASFGETLTRAHRFNIYNFVCANISEEIKINFTAKLVQDILSVAVDNAKKLLPDRSAMGSSAVKGRRNAAGATPFENVLEDVLLFLQTPVLKIGLKSTATVAEDDLEDVNDSADNNQALAAAKTKVLKTITSQHLIAHTLPVVISLKHVMESTKSPLQGALMDFLIHLMKHHRQEVEQTLSFDPTLKAEVEYDLKQYEKHKQQQSALLMQQDESFRSAIKRSALKPSTVSKAPRLSMDMLPPSSIHKSAVREMSLLQSGRKADRDSARKPIISTPSIVGSSMKSSSSSSSQVRATVERSSSVTEDDDEDPMLRLTQSYVLPDEEERMADKGGSRRRSWGVVVSSLVDENQDVNVAAAGDNQAKKRRKASEDVQKGSLSRGGLLSLLPIAEEHEPPAAVAKKAEAEAVKEKPSRGRAGATNSLLMMI